MYKPYLSRQKSGKSVQTTVSAGDKTTLKLVTEQLRASQKVLNKSDQFIPSVVAWCEPEPLSPPPTLALGQSEARRGRPGTNERPGPGWPVLSLSQPLAGPTELSWVRQHQANITTFLAISLDPTSDNNKSYKYDTVSLIWTHLAQSQSGSAQVYLPELSIFIFRADLRLLQAMAMQTQPTLNMHSLKALVHWHCMHLKHAHKEALNT